MAMVRVSKLLGSNFNHNPNSNFSLTLIMRFRIPEIVVDNSTRQRGLAWDKINDDDRAKYCDLSDANLLRIPIPHDALRCIDANCTNVNSYVCMYMFIH